MKAAGGRLVERWELSRPGCRSVACTKHSCPMSSSDLTNARKRKLADALTPATVKQETPCSQETGERAATGTNLGLVGSLCIASWGRNSAGVGGSAGHLLPARCRWVVWWRPSPASRRARCRVERVVLRRAAHGLAELAKTGAWPCPAARAFSGGWNAAQLGSGPWVRADGGAQAEISRVETRAGSLKQPAPLGHWTPQRPWC